MDILTKVDKNFEIKSKIEKDDIAFYDSYKAPFKTYGVFKENGEYLRMPKEIAKEVNEGVYLLCSNTAGGRVRFMTDSPYVAIYAELSGVYNRPRISIKTHQGLIYMQTATIAEHL